MIRQIVIIRVLTVALTIGPAGLYADVFNMPSGQSSLDFVTVGDPGNAGNAGVGAVSYVYQIGKYDVTAAQYAQFLNAVAATDKYGLYNSFMANVTTSFNLVGDGIVQSGSPGNYAYSVISGRENFPINWVSWGDAARFANWLQNGQPSGAQGPGTTETGVYTLNGATSQSALMTINRNAGASYFIPSLNEWYKAAYYKGGGINAGYWSYATRSNTVPSNVLSATGTNNANYNTTGNFLTPNYTDPVNLLTSVGAFASSPGPYGTYDQAGDMRNWNETNNGGLYRGVSGFSFDGPVGNAYETANIAANAESPTAEYWSYGFRVGSVAVVPDPSTLCLAVCGLAIVALNALYVRQPLGRLPGVVASSDELIVKKDSDHGPLPA
jgi:formylglycine-generating enzyme